MTVDTDECYVLVREVGDGNLYFAHWKEGATCVDGSYVEGGVEEASRFSSRKAAYDELLSSGQKGEGWRVKRLRITYSLVGRRKAK